MSWPKINTIPKNKETLATISANPIHTLRAFLLFSVTPDIATSSAPKKKSNPCKSISIPVVVNTIFGVKVFHLIKVIKIVDSTMRLKLSSTAD
jgi:hypothetical protein